MFWKSKRPTAEAAKRVAEVGWLLQSDQASFIWEAPRPVSRAETPVAGHAKSVAYCPSVIDHEARLYEVPCPIDLHLRFRFNEKGDCVIIDVAGEKSAVRASILPQMVVVVPRPEWRHPNRPVLQMPSPYTFLADEPVWMTQMPPFIHYRNPQWPGLLIGGRLPIDVWPRPMMWAFEWFDIEQDLILKRGEPWFYVRFETPDASRKVRLVEAEMTPQLKEYIAGLSGVTNYVNRTFSLFQTAQSRRPEKLLVKRARVPAGV